MGKATRQGRGKIATNRLHSLLSGHYPTAGNTIGKDLFHPGDESTRENRFEFQEILFPVEGTGITRSSVKYKHTIPNCFTVNCHASALSPKNSFILYLIDLQVTSNMPGSMPLSTPLQTHWETNKKKIALLVYINELLFSQIIIKEPSTLLLVLILLEFSCTCVICLYQLPI